MKKKRESIVVRDFSQTVSNSKIKTYNDLKKKRRSIKIIILALVSAIIICAAGLGTYYYFSLGIKTTLKVEAREGTVQASDFTDKEDASVSFISTQEIDLSEPGTHKLRIKIGLIIRDVKLIIEDTTPPEAEARPRKIKIGDSPLGPKKFVKNIKDNTAVTAELKEAIDYNTPGYRNVTVILTDKGLNKTEIESSLTIYPRELKDTLTIEAGSEKPKLEDYLEIGFSPYEGDGLDDETLGQVINTAGEHTVDATYGGLNYPVTLNVVDTTPPTGEVKPIQIYAGNEVAAEDFFTVKDDVTRVTASFKEKPDFSKIGEQTVSLILTDEGGNTSEYESLLTVIEDTVPPVISASSRTVYLGDNIRFTEGVTATDENDGKVEVKVDTGDFDKNTAGTYAVTYSAKDKSGNESTLTVYFTLTQKQSTIYTQELIDGNFRVLYARLITEDMTDREKLKAIYDYARENIVFNGSSDKSDEEQEAYRGIIFKKGDSFTYYCVCKKLMTMAGFENKGLERVHSDSSHYWNYVKVGESWLHLDACPHYKDYPLDSFLLTDEEVAAYSEKTNGYYEYKTGETLQ